MTLETNLNVRLGEDETAVIEAERKRLAAQGIKASTSQVVRGLILRGSTRTDIPNGNPKSMTSEKFELTG
jgi:hypothetical protein